MRLTQLLLIGLFAISINSCSAHRHLDEPSSSSSSPTETSEASHPHLHLTPLQNLHFTPDDFPARINTIPTGNQGLQSQSPIRSREYNSDPSDQHSHSNYEIHISDSPTRDRRNSHLNDGPFNANHHFIPQHRRIAKVKSNRRVGFVREHSTDQLGNQSNHQSESYENHQVTQQQTQNRLQNHQSQSQTHTQSVETRSPRSQIASHQNNGQRLQIISVSYHLVHYLLPMNVGTESTLRVVPVYSFEQFKSYFHGVVLRYGFFPTSSQLSCQLRVENEMKGMFHKSSIPMNDNQVEPHEWDSISLWLMSPQILVMYDNMKNNNHNIQVDVYCRQSSAPSRIETDKISFMIKYEKK